MSLSIKRSFVENFNFNGKVVTSVHINGTGECLITSNVGKAVGYEKEAGVKQIQRLVPEKYKIRLGDACVDLEGVDESVHTQPITVLLKEPGLYCFLTRCGKPEAEPFMEWVVEEVLPREVRKLVAAINEKDMQVALLVDDLTDAKEQARQLEYNNTGFEKMGYRHKYVRKEKTTLSHVQEAFKGENIIDYYQVDGYRIDLYFLEYNLAIECDELCHTDRDIEYEVKRRKYIEEKLKCSFIRFNLDAEEFNIFHVINRIYQQLC